MTTTIEAGQVYRDEDGHNWRVVGFCGNGWPAVRPTSNPKAHAIMTNPAWFDVWALVT